ncbi:hypothetical protein [Bacillus badius]|uniref:hypothetical protein n=1 Tax=Bacillus badius TaxID=1455 RepID=UPI0007B38E61|nr:hypothetical protein [Bacillus badius]KZR59338.1 hypothetical protein A3781_13130 [Bacillus badius]
MARGRGKNRGEKLRSFNVSFYEDNFENEAERIVVIQKVEELARLNILSKKATEWVKQGLLNEINNTTDSPFDKSKTKKVGETSTSPSVEEFETLLDSFGKNLLEDLKEILKNTSQTNANTSLPLNNEVPERKIESTEETEEKKKAKRKAKSKIQGIL